jgi:hypothetical protein
MKYGKTTVSVSSLIRRNWLTTEMRERINDGKVLQYASEIKDGANFPCPDVFVDPKTEQYLVGDGFHRILAHKENRSKTIEVELRRGRYLDAVLFNIEANRKHRGLPFTQGDLGKCIETLLRDKESSKWTQTKIAETVGCSIAYTSQVVKNLASCGPEWLLTAMAGCCPISTPPRIRRKWQSGGSKSLNCFWRELPRKPLVSN